MHTGTLSVHVPWCHRLMQKRNEKKKEVGLRPQRKLEDFECSSDGRHIGSHTIRYAKMPSSSKRKKEEKKGKRGKLHKFSEKGTKRKCSGERSYPDSNRGNQKFFDISSL